MRVAPAQEQVLLNLSRNTIRRALGEPVAAMELPDDPLFQQPAGAFVTLHELHTKTLRGCIGRLSADEPLGTTVREMSEGVLQDPRFTDRPVKLSELPGLELEISILSPMEPASNPLDFDLMEHGIYLKLAGRTGCFLPQVARETGWTKEQLLSRLCTEKMGLSANAWQSGGQLLRFTSTILGPVPFLDKA